MCKIMKIIVVSVAFASLMSLPCIADTNSNKLLPELRKSEAWNSYDARDEYLRRLNSKQLLQLCDELGEAVDKGELDISKAQYYIANTMGVFRQKKKVTPNTFLSVLKDRKASSFWRNFACENSFASPPHYISKGDVSLEESFQAYTNVILDSKSPASLRKHVYWCCWRMLGEGYVWILCDFKGQRRKDPERALIEEVRNSSLTIWDDHDKRVSWFIEFSLSEYNAQEGIHFLTILDGLKNIIRVRGAKTPQIEKLRAFASTPSEKGSVSKEKYKKSLKDKLEQYAPLKKENLELGEGSPTH